MGQREADIINEKIVLFEALIISTHTMLTFGINRLFGREDVVLGGCVYVQTIATLMANCIREGALKANGEEGDIEPMLDEMLAMVKDKIEALRKNPLPGDASTQQQQIEAT